MSRLGCACGNTIFDTSDSLLYKGRILPDTKFYEISDFLTDIINSLTEANRLGERYDWIKKHFDVPPYPTDLSDGSMINDLLSEKLFENTQVIYQCKNCGRISIEVGQTNYFKFFKPDEGDTLGILSGTVQ